MIDDDTQALMLTLSRAAELRKQQGVPAHEEKPQPDAPPALSDGEVIQWMATSLGICPDSLDAAVKAIRSGDSVAPRLPTAQAETPHDISLLSAIRNVFECGHVNKISTKKLIESLCAVDGAWATYSKGKPITPKQVAGQLAAFGIASKTIRIGTYETPKGFEITQFSDAFAHHLPEAMDVPPQPQHLTESINSGSLPVADNPPHRAEQGNAETLQKVKEVDGRAASSMRNIGADRWKYRGRSMTARC